MRIYYGWVVVAISSLIVLLVMGTTVSVYGLYVLPVAKDFDLSRADVNTAFVVGNIGGALLSPIIGRLADTYPVRWVMSFGALCYMFGLVVLGLSHNMWISAAVLGLAMPFVIAGIASLGAMTLVARWFEAQRGRAMAITVIGMSLGSVVMAPIVGWMIGEFGWRASVMGQGIVIGCVFLVLIYFLRERPGPDDIEPLPKRVKVETHAHAAPPRDAKPLSTKQILRIAPFWILAGAMAFSMGMFQAIHITLVPMVQEQGVDVTTAAGLLSVMGFTGLIGKFALAWIGDAFDKALVLAMMLLSMAAIVAFIPVPNTFAVIVVLAGMLGLAGSVMLPLFLALLADHVGSASFASANGMASLMLAISGAVAMRLSGEIYDRSGSYDGLFFFLAGCFTIAAMFMFALSRLSRLRAVAAAA